MACSAIKEVRFISLYRRGKWPSVTCNACATAKTSRQWLCSCGTAWIACSLHAAPGFACSSRMRIKRRPRSKYLQPRPGFTSNALIHEAMPTRRIRVTTKRTHERQSSSSSNARARTSYNPDMPWPSVRQPEPASSSTDFSIITARPPGSSPVLRSTNRSSARKRPFHVVHSAAVAAVKRLRQDPLPLSASSY